MSPIYRTAVDSGGGCQRCDLDASVRTAIEETVWAEKIEFVWGP